MIAFNLGELFGGSNGMKCNKCNNRTWTVWLTSEENEKLKNTIRDPRNIVCEEKLGIILCERHSPDEY